MRGPKIGLAPAHFFPLKGPDYNISTFQTLRDVMTHKNRKPSPTL